MPSFPRFVSVMVALAVLVPRSLGAQPIVQPQPPAIQPASPIAPPPVYVLPGPLPASRESRARGVRGQIMTGSILFGVAHGAAWTLAVLLGPTDRRAWWLALPFGGPSVWGALWGCRNDPDDTCRSLLATGGGFWSALQLGGAVTLLIGLTRLPSDSAPRVAVGPLVLPGARGLAVFGAL